MTPSFHLLRRPFIAFVGLVALCAFAAVPASADTVQGSGRKSTQTRAVSGYTGVSLSLPALVELRVGTTEGVTVEADENLLPLIDTRVRNGMLEIRAARRGLELETTAMKVVVQARRINKLSVGGAGSINADALRSPQLDLEIGGSGAITVRQAEAEKVSVAIGGSGEVKIGGTTRKFEVAIGGSGDVAAAGLQADDVEVSIGGSGDAAVWARQTLSLAVAGSGDVSYYGDPKVKQTVVGSGKARRISAAPPR